MFNNNHSSWYHEPYLFLLTDLIFASLTEEVDVEVDVESIMFDCLDSDGQGITHADADHCYSSMDKAWLWQVADLTRFMAPSWMERGGNIPKTETAEEGVTVQHIVFTQGSNVWCFV